MSFDRTKPVNGTTVDADLLHSNMNDLDDSGPNDSGDLPQFDGMSQIWKPALGVTQNVQVSWRIRRRVRRSS